MRTHSIVTAALLLTAAAPQVKAQSASAGTLRPSIAPRAGGSYSYSFSDDDSPRAVLGVSTSTSGSKRDTLGLLISTVAAGGPAEKAGIEEGNRISAINGVSLKVSAEDVEDWESSGVASRRFTRELGKAKVGDEVELKVYGGGQTRTVRVKLADSDSLYPNERRAYRIPKPEDRPALGVNLGSTGSKRDTIGVLVIGVTDDGPAAKAGIEEGSRIASINGVNLKLSKDDIDDNSMSSNKVNRLQREIAKLKPNDEVDLRVYAAGQYRNVKVKLGNQKELSKGRGGMVFISGGEGGMLMPTMSPVPPMAERQMRQEMERAMTGVRMQLRSMQGGELSPTKRTIVIPRTYNQQDDEQSLEEAARVRQEKVKVKGKSALTVSRSA
ncbi:MAG: hypothetical protein JWO05_2429 [Gemmatimonadetes bacterium]|nr:hypothetical protein [Gemmatimonadota bacterium]